MGERITMTDDESCCTSLKGDECCMYEMLPEVKEMMIKRGYGPLNNLFVDWRPFDAADHPLTNLKITRAPQHSVIWAPEHLSISGDRWQRRRRRGEPGPWGGPTSASWHNHAHRFLRQDCHLLCPTSNCLPPLADLTRHPKAVRWVSKLD